MTNLNNIHKNLNGLIACSACCEIHNTINSCPYAREATPTSDITVDDIELDLPVSKTRKGRR